MIEAYLNTLFLVGIIGMSIYSLIYILVSIFSPREREQTKLEKEAIGKRFREEKLNY